MQVRPCFEGSFTLVISRPESLVVPQTLTCECVDVCAMLEFLIDTLLYALTD